MQGLHAVALFAQGDYDDAINLFIELDVNPAKIVALYPEQVSGRLAVSEARWIELFDGPRTKGDPAATLQNDKDIGEAVEVVTVETGASRPASPPSSDDGRDGKDSLDRNSQKPPPPSKRILPSTAFADVLKAAKYRQSVETLLRYLSDRRQKVSGSLTALHIASSLAAEATPLSAASVEEIFALPNCPPSALAPQQLFRVAQIVDTALFKSYLVVRPGLLGPLCRLDNWCEVSEVEYVLRQHGVSAYITITTIC